MRTGVCGAPIPKLVLHCGKNNRAKYRGESQKWVKNTGDIVDKCQFHMDF